MLLASTRKVLSPPREPKACRTWHAFLFLRSVTHARLLWTRIRRSSGTQCFSLVRVGRTEKVRRFMCTTGASHEVLLTFRRP